MRIKVKARKKKSLRKFETVQVWPRSPGYWVAVGTLAAYTVAGHDPHTILYAQRPKGAPPPVYSQESGALPARQFGIPAGPLDTVIAAFEIASGLQVDIAIPAIGEVQSPGVSGFLPVEEALNKLLTGTGVTYHFTKPGRVVLELRGLRQSVEVTDNVPLSSPKYTEPIRNLPQTISVIPRAVIEQQGATSLSEVLRNVPGLTIAAGEGGTPAGDNLTLRGFSARNDVFVDGVRDLGPQSRDPFNLEQVEVIKGPQSAFTGRGSTGGSINLVSKAPNLNRFIGGSLSLGNASIQRFTTDVNLPLARLGLGERTAFRMNFLEHDAGVPGRDAVESERRGIAPSLLFGGGTPTRLTLGYYRLHQNNIPDYGIPWVTATQNALADYRNQPAPVPRDTFYGLKSRDREKMGSDMATVRFEHDFDDSLLLWNQLRYGRSTRDSITTAPRFANNDSLTINRNGPSWLTEDDVWDSQTDLRASLQTGSVKHTAVLGATFSREHNRRKSRSVTGSPTTTLFNPDPNQPFEGTITLNPIVGDATGGTQAFYAFDTVRFGQQFQLNGGLRWDRFAVDGVHTNGNPLDRTDTMLSGRAGAVYTPAQNGSFYVSYGTSLNPSLEGLTYQPADTTLEPEKTYSVEGGTKWDLLNGRLSLSGAVFRVEKTNARTPGVLPDDPPMVLDGEQRVAGVEIGISGSLTRRWSLYSAYTYLASKILRSNNPAEVGNELTNTPPHSLNIWTTYRLGKLDLGGGTRFVDRRFNNNSNVRRADGYWTADAMASYPIVSHLDLRLNLYNLNNAYYFERLGGGHLIPGPARAGMITANFRF
ncbi:MAG: TonB-dependent siderophore receptor [Bryobacterales bacterium]|nr:TonB-dependent siderophore receptor [Bryobacterales bacterium]